MKISIITICYNAESEIVSTMESVLSQSFDDLEYLIIDGKSNDGTVNRVKSVIAKYPNRRIYLISEPDKGIYDAMNKGLKMAKGEWVNIMNAGDCFADNEVLKNIFDRPISDNINFIYSDFYKKTSSGQYFLVKTSFNEQERLLVHQSIIYRKKLHEEYGYYTVTPKIIISDYLFFLRIPVHEAMKVNTVIAKYEGNGISESGTWCIKQSLCADVVFRHKKFERIFLSYIIWRIKHCVPIRIREYIRLKLSGVRIK